MENIVKRSFRALFRLIFGKRTVKFSKPAIEFRHEEPKPQRATFGKGRAYKNNRRRTNGRKIQYCHTCNGVRFIFHESF